ncbi:MAG: transporter substrate-binding domain-containing protein [Spirochaetales bacterium]|nr:transporter substrate-binding domain-containing protein [Spirochaetales bacterium]
MAVINKKFLFVILVLLVYFAQSEIGAETLSTNLSVAVDASVIPYCFFDDTGLMRGIMVDMLDEIAKTENLNVKYSIYNSYDACFEALSKAQVDMILGGANVDTSDKSFRSLLLMSSSLCAVASSDIADEIESGNITLYTVAMDYNSKKISSQYMSMNSRIGGNLTKVVADQEVLFQSFLAGKEDLAVADKESIKYLLAQNEITSQYRIIFNYLAPTDYSLVVRSDNPSLYRRMRSGVEHLRASGNLERIIERWTEDKSGIILSNIMIRRIAGIGILITIIVVAYIVLNFLMNRELRKKVAEKTRDINLANQALEDKVQKLHNEGMLRTKIIENSPTDGFT